MDDFINKIQKQLQIMSEKEKDAWILSQAKISPEWKQEDFYKSICGIKKIIDMPDRQEIDDFCKKVCNGDIAVEYESHYVEFDDYGYFHDRWMHEFHDSTGAMAFISSVVQGCHDLIILEQYAQAYEILDELLGLKFTIANYPDTDAACKDEFFDLHCAVREEILCIDTNELLRDYIKACRNAEKNIDIMAKKIAAVLEMKLFEECKLCDCIPNSPKDSLLPSIKRALEESLVKAEGYSQNERNINCIKSLIEYFAGIGKKEKEPQESFLKGTWSQIKALIDDLEDEPYIDDQFEIEEIWDIVEALIKRGGFEKEAWEVKEEILKEIYKNEFFDYYSVYDPMHDLVDVICSTKEENLKRAKLMMDSSSEFIRRDGAKLYKELGEEKKCVEYFEKHLGKGKEPYEIVMNYYKNLNYDKAVEIAELAIENCKDDQTPFFIFLMQDAKEKREMARFKKLSQSAHRRKAVNASEVDEVFS